MVAEIGVIKESELVEWLLQVEGLVAKVCLIRAQLYVIILKGGPEGLAAK